MAEIKLFQYKYQNDSVSNRKPIHTHLVIETAAPLIYMVDSGDQTKVYGSNDKGVTWTQIDVDPSNSSGDNKSRDYLIRACWHDKANEIIYFIDGTNDDSTNAIDCWTLDYSGGFGSESVIEVGTIVASGTKDWINGIDVFIIGAVIYVTTKEHESAEPGSHDSYSIFNFTTQAKIIGLDEPS